MVVSALILVAVLRPGEDVPTLSIMGLDKLVHFILFFVWSLAVRYDGRAKFRWPLGWLAGFGFSVLTEVLQLFTESRMFDGWDILFDALGLTTGLLVGTPVLKWLKVLRSGKS